MRANLLNARLSSLAQGCQLITQSFQNKSTSTARSHQILLYSISLHHHTSISSIPHQHLMQPDHSQGSNGSNSPMSVDEHEVPGSAADLHNRLEAAKYALESEEDEKQRMQMLWSRFSEEELNRYEMFRRSTFPKASIKRIMQSISGNSISQNVVIAMSGIAKVFVGELVEEALKIQTRYGETGPVEPKHIREAHRVIKNRSDKSVRLT